MAHPIKLLKELEKITPNLSVAQWIFGIFRTNRNDTGNGIKGLLAANDKSLFFISGSSKEKSEIMEFSIDEVDRLETELSGTVKMSIHFIHSEYVEMSYISRGNTKEFIRFLHVHCKNLKDEVLSVEKTEQ